MTPTIRRANLDDIPVLVEMTDEIQALHAKGRPDLFVYPQERAALIQHYKTALESENNYLLLIEVEGRTEGHMHAEIRRSLPNAFKFASAVLYIHQLGIRGSARRTGLGQKLMNAASDLAQSHRIEEVRLEYWTFNKNAQRFYAKNGFKQVREIVSKTV